MSKHTPGPWKYSDECVSTTDNGDYIILAEVHSTFGTDSFGEEPLMLGPEEREANARLMAAAPDLLEAAIVQQECGLPSKVTMYDEDGCEGWIWRHPDGREWMEIGDWSEPPTLHPLMRTAIAKAKGGGNE